MNQDELKQAVGKSAAEYIDHLLTKDAIVGVGTGSTANCLIDSLAERKHKFDGAVASSEATAERLKGHGIPVYDLNDVDELLVEASYILEVTAPPELEADRFLPAAR